MVALLAPNLNHKLNTFDADGHLAALPDMDFKPAAADWRAKAADLADWTMRHMVNRADTYGNYYQPGPSCGNARKAAPLTPAVLAAHYSGLSDRVGLYSYGKDGLGRWTLVDIDA